MGLVLALVALAAGSPFAGGPVPSTVVDSFRVEVRAPSGRESIAWQAPESLAARLPDGDVVEVNGTLYATSEGGRGYVERRRFAARPDGDPPEPDLSRAIAELVLAQARGGKRQLFETTLHGRAAYRTSISLRANECSGLGAGRATIWLDRETLLPLRLVEQGAGLPAWTRSYRYDDLNVRLPESTFSPPELGKNPLREDLGFVRAAPAHAAGPLSYTPSLATVLPPGSVAQFGRRKYEVSPITSSTSPGLVASGIESPTSSMPRRGQNAWLPPSGMVALLP